MIIGISCVRNEQDIIGENLIHHFNEGVDKFIISNHKSIDKTRDIVSGFKDVEIIDIECDDYLHGVWMTNMARKAFDSGADWVVPIDADEFWSGISFLMSVDATIGVLKLPHFFTHPPTKKATYENFSRSQMPFFRKTVRNAWANHPSGRLVFRPTSNIEVSDGNHLLKNALPNHVFCEEIVMRHYSIRSFKQFKKKVMQSESSLKNLPPSIATHWRDWNKSGDLYNVYVSKLVDENSGLEEYIP